ncbi:MAG: glycoside hydrolase family 27 protein [Firmicutes bacterium]|nr:glycoside hydrolase family 27 protein [Bacillota bacterium]
MDKNLFAPTPPMGWNSWDCYGAAVTEDEIRGNAEYMAEHMKEFGWEYIVCDIQWYEPNAVDSAYRPFVPLEMDEYSRLIPAVNRFPSAAYGQGFKPLADYIHSLGLKFGIHMLRGIPRQAVHANTPILGTRATARDIAHPFSVCSWNTDMYGINPTAYGAQQYYNSVFDLYASWGVDFVKVDDICVTYFQPHNLYSAQGEIELIRRAIDQCGRPMVLSLSPGPALIEQAEHLKKNANMWRMTGDLWDNWAQLSELFDRCRTWQDHVGNGCWPDCDMLPLGHIGIRSVEHGKTDRWTELSYAEQITMMSLFCIFRSPLMMGGELRDNDGNTLELLTNPEVLRLLNHAHGAHEVTRGSDSVIWTSKDEDGSTYVALFNTGTRLSHIECSFASLGLTGPLHVRDLWAHQDLGIAETSVHAYVDFHSCRLLKLSL